MLCAGNKCYRVLNASANFSSAIGFCRELLGNPKKKAFLTSSTDAFENGMTKVQYVCRTCVCDRSPRDTSSVRLCSQRS